MLVHEIHCLSRPSDAFHAPAFGEDCVAAGQFAHDRGNLSGPDADCLGDLLAGEHNLAGVGVEVLEQGAPDHHGFSGSAAVGAEPLDDGGVLRGLEHDERLPWGVGPGLAVDVVQQALHMALRVSLVIQEGQQGGFEGLGLVLIEPLRAGLQADDIPHVDNPRIARH